MLEARTAPAAQAAGHSRWAARVAHSRSAGHIAPVVHTDSAARHTQTLERYFHSLGWAALAALADQMTVNRQVDTRTEGIVQYLAARFEARMTDTASYYLLLVSEYGWWLPRLPDMLGGGGSRLTRRRHHAPPRRRLQAPPATRYHHNRWDQSGARDDHIGEDAVIICAGDLAHPTAKSVGACDDQIGEGAVNRRPGGKETHPAKGERGVVIASYLRAVDKEDEMRPGRSHLDGVGRIKARCYRVVGGEIDGRGTVGIHAPHEDPFTAAINHERIVVIFVLLPEKEAVGPVCWATDLPHIDGHIDIVLFRNRHSAIVTSRRMESIIR